MSGFVLDRVQRLVNRVGTAEVPGLAHALLRRDGRDIATEHRRHPPRLGDVAVEAVRLVLRQHDDLSIAGVDDIAQGKIDEAVDPAEGTAGFARSAVSGIRRLPSPPARTMTRTFGSFPAAMAPTYWVEGPSRGMVMECSGSPVAERRSSY